MRAFCFLADLVIDNWPCTTVPKCGYVNVRGLTALHASSEEVTEWINNGAQLKTDNSGQFSDSESRLLQSQEASSSGSNVTTGSSTAKARSGSDKTRYPFICECFFMTARVLNLGLLKAFSDFKHLVQVAINHALVDKRNAKYHSLNSLVKNLCVLFFVFHLFCLMDLFKSSKFLFRIYLGVKIHCPRSKPCRDRGLLHSLKWI